MEMNRTNFVSACKEVVIDLSLLLSSYREIAVDDESTHGEIELLDGRFGEILSRLNDVITFAGQERQTADMVSDSLSAGLKMTSEIMSEKTRIIKTCAALANPFNVDDHISLN